MSAAERRGRWLRDRSKRNAHHPDWLYRMVHLPTTTAGSPCLERSTVSHSSAVLADVELHAADLDPADLPGLPAIFRLPAPGAGTNGRLRQRPPLPHGSAVLADLELLPHQTAALRSPGRRADNCHGLHAIPALWPTGRRTAGSCFGSHDLLQHADCCDGLHANPALRPTDRHIADICDGLHAIPALRPSRHDARRDLHATPDLRSPGRRAADLSAHHGKLHRCGPAALDFRRKVRNRTGDHKSFDSLPAAHHPADDSFFYLLTGS